MRPNLIALLVLALCSWTVQASPIYSRQMSSPARNGTTCARVTERREWRSLNATEQDSYIQAVLCLKNKPPASPNPYDGVRSLYDHFQGEHIAKAMTRHWSGLFMPFHRLLIWTYERELAACGYDGGQPYWSWAIDAEGQSMEESPLFSNDSFGGNGVFIPAEERPVPPDQFVSPFLPPPAPVFGNETVDPADIGTGGGCVQTGSFSEASGFEVAMGPGNSTEYAPHCLQRDFSFADLQAGNRTSIEACLARRTYASFHRCAEGTFGMDGEEHPTIHASGHQAIGAEMSNVFSSPGDPIFWLHHANLDRAWWLWQQQDPSNLLAMGDNALSFDFFETGAGDATLDDELEIGALHDTVAVRTVMETEKSLCYTYADPPSSI